MTTTPSRMTVREQPAFVVGDTPSTDGAPDPEEGEWHHNVTHRCPQMGAHTFDRLPIPCEQCTSVEQLTRSIPWQESYFFSRPLRSAAAAGLRVVPEDRPAPCPRCNDDGVVHTHDGIVIGPCSCPPVEHKALAAPATTILCGELRIERTDDAQSDQGAWHVDDGVQVVFFPDAIEAAHYIGTLDGLGMAREMAASRPASDDRRKRDLRATVGWLLWCADEGYLTDEDRAVGSGNWFNHSDEMLSEHDRRNRSGFLEMADAVIAAMPAPLALDDDTRREVEALIEQHQWAIDREHPCSGACLGCGAGVDESCDPDCGCHEGEMSCDTAQVLEQLGPLIRFAARYLGGTE